MFKTKEEPKTAFVCYKTKVATGRADLVLVTDDGILRKSYIGNVSNRSCNIDEEDLQIINAYESAHYAMMHLKPLMEYININGTVHFNVRLKRAYVEMMDDKQINEFEYSVLRQV